MPHTASIRSYYLRYVNRYNVYECGKRNIKLDS